MLNKKTSNRSNLSKMGLIFPLLLAFMLTFNVHTEAQVIQKTKVVLNDVQFYPDELASAIITKNSTKAELDDFSRKFKEQGVELQFKRLKYSKEGLLTRINIKYEIEKTGDSGNFNKNSDAAIDDIEITLTEDFNIEFRSLQTKNENHEFVVISDSNSVTIGSIAMPKKRIWKTNLDDVTMERVIYTTPSKTTSKGMFSVGNKVQYYASNTDSISGKGQIRNVNSKEGNRMTWTDSETDTIKHKYRVIVIDSAHTNASNISKNVRVISRERKPLFIVNGEVENNDFHSESIDPDNIENIYVLKDATAIKKYGSKGKNGVIEINTKKNKNVYQKDIIAFEGNTKNTEMFVISPKSMDFLVVVDGKIKDKSFEIESINPEDIKNVIVLKNKSATEKYGKKGEKGVVEITLKEKN